MAEAQSLPLISQYSDVFTRLHEGRLECVSYGMNRVVLNRFILDAAESTATPDDNELISMVDPDKVDGDGSVEQKRLRCSEKLMELVALQEEVNTLQKAAREKGLSGGLLTIVGQASIQSPDDHGASVIHQLSALMGGTEKANRSGPGNDVDSIIAAANDDQEPLTESDSRLNQMTALLRDNWQPLSVDIMVCLVASVFAISLVS